jgi:hypothetical protein
MKHPARPPNVAVVTGNLLPYKARYQRLANDLPKGSVLICLPSTGGPQRKALRIAAVLLEAEGHRVTTLPAEMFSLTQVEPVSDVVRVRRRRSPPPTLQVANARSSTAG